jgi:hypothetical protein
MTDKEKAALLLRAFQILEGTVPAHEGDCDWDCEDTCALRAEARSLAMRAGENKS